MSATGLILAAGAGERLHGESKAFLQWRREPLIVHVARAMAGTCTSLRIGVRAEEHDRARLALQAGRIDTPCELVTGGATRRETVLKLIDGVADEWMILHDVARPFASGELFARVLAAAHEHGAASAAASLKERDGIAEHAEGFIDRVLPYARLTYMQTPQACRIAWLRDALRDTALDHEHSVCGLLRARGHPVSLVSTSADNVKITYPEDVQLLRWRLS